MRDYRLPAAAWTDGRGLDSVFEAIIGSSEFRGGVDLPGTTRGQRAVVALLLVDALVGNGGFEEFADVDLLQSAREASELVDAYEHRALLDSRDGERWYAREAALRERLTAYVESHKDEFFTESDEARATWERVKATFTAESEWLARTVAEIDRDVAGQEWLLHRFGDRGTYSETSALLLLRPDDMREAIQAATAAGLQPREFAFYAEVEASPEFEPIDADPLDVLGAGLARHAAEWVAVELTPASVEQ
jgi:hypothetical protein